MLSQNVGILECLGPTWKGPTQALLYLYIGSLPFVEWLCSPPSWAHSNEGLGTHPQLVQQDLVVSSSRLQRFFFPRVCASKRPCERFGSQCGRGVGRGSNSGFSNQILA